MTDTPEKLNSKKLIVFIQMYPPVRDGKPYRLGEVYNSIDGPRTRLTDRTFAQANDAQAFITLAATTKGVG